jgi:antitoxin component YwqK of YwqJK toxin-antitoxin module
MNKGRYKNHIRVGLWREYYNNGNLKIRGHYYNCKNPILITRANIDSIQSIYPALFNDSQLYFKDFLELKSGKWQYFNEQGNLIKEEFYEKGHLVKTVDY